MARKASPIGPHLLALIEDARVDLARAALAVREGDKEPDFKLPEDVPDLDDEEAVEAFRQALVETLSDFDRDDLRPAEHRSRRIRALAEKKGVTSLTTIVEQQLDNTRSLEFHHQPDELCRSIWAYLH
ncbi:MAG: hypothetical protein ACK4NV_12945 [Pannonibacter sp.]